MASIAAILGLAVAPQIIGSIGHIINPNAPAPEKSSVEKIIDFITQWLPIMALIFGAMYVISFIRSMSKS